MENVIMISRKRITTGVEGLDALIGGGLQQNKVFMICGEAGTGKTIFCLQYVLGGLQRGESAVYVSIDEKPSHLLEDAESLGWDLKKYMDQEQLAILDVTPYFTNVRTGKEKDIDARIVITDLSKQIRKLKATRLVIDPIAPLIFGQEATARLQEYIRSLIFSIEDNLKCTTLITSGIPSGTKKLSQYEVEEFVASGIIVLGINSLQGRRVRSVHVRKMRGTPIDLNDHIFEIMSQRGIVIREAI
jgi:circadian clock protein KaiC